MKFQSVGFLLFFSMTNWAYNEESSSPWGLEVPSLHEGSWKALSLPGTVPLNGGFVGPAAGLSPRVLKGFFA
jgi:hypothetical protein